MFENLKPIFYVLNFPEKKIKTLSHYVLSYQKLVTFLIWGGLIILFDS